ncbi:uncharacterized protein SCODWIG_00476 [Saccharomycodes ludwigii]|uniref:Uncharacterized protein n=1 Tax=Saccharomycodes ludwigii TaxID=36035 RepID=A0A376B1Z8_9ASCO|nr:hypothetical protein SCDLUD_003075 [Saccharomycodes ludwigii]KAH3900108.1 hypothetical protein SCDLUD_003075 [Saccharomycodes ludwigii]SSD58715.1 uncharacterized protein SCODWIG_00476 [Saccharomycodes ludwigii]
MFSSSILENISDSNLADINYNDNQNNEKNNNNNNIECLTYTKKTLFDTTFFRHIQEELNGNGNNNATYNARGAANLNRISGNNSNIEERTQVYRKQNSKNGFHKRRRRFMDRFIPLNAYTPSTDIPFFTFNENDVACNMMFEENYRYMNSLRKDIKYLGWNTFVPIGCDKTMAELEHYLKEEERNTLQIKELDYSNRVLRRSLYENNNNTNNNHDTSVHSVNMDINLDGDITDSYDMGQDYAMVEEDEYEYEEHGQYEHNSYLYNEELGEQGHNEGW